ncbi:type VII secretion system (T7SS), usher family protein, partial [Vibrio parahaemolyticus VP2007-007]
HQRF